MTKSSGIIQTENLSVFHFQKPLLKDINIVINPQQITGIMGKSGTGKSLLLRCFNRLNDFHEALKIEGKIWFNHQDIYSNIINPVELRRSIGIVFQRPLPFPTSIYQNIAMPLKLSGYQDNLDDIVEYSLHRVGLWDEVKNNLRLNATLLSGGQKQRLCIARAIALQPQVVLLDEPCSSLDPISTQIIEELLLQLKQDYTIVITTHNLKQIARICDHVIFLDIQENEQREKFGFVVEQNPVEKIFLNPENQATSNYLGGTRINK